MSIQPACTLLRHAKDPKRFILERMCVLKGIGCLTSLGRLVLLTEHDTRSRAVDLMLEDFEEFQHRDSDDGAEASGLSPEAKRVQKLLSRDYSVWFQRKDAKTRRRKGNADL